MKFVLPLLWKSKWLIAAATAFAAALALMLTTSSRIEIWSGRAIMTIGLAPANDFIAQKSGPAVSPIEMPRRTVNRLSEPAFKAMIVARAAFDPATASISKSIVASSLRGILLDKEREVAIELSAGSAADVKSAFRAIAAEVGAMHTEIFNRQIDVIQRRIDDDTVRIASIEKEISELNERILKSTPPTKRNELASSPVTPVLLAMISAWNGLESEVRNDMALRQLGELTALRVDVDNLVVTHRTIDRLQASLLAGAGMLVAMIILTIVIHPSNRFDGKLGRTDLTER